MATRRQFLLAAGGSLVAGAGLGGYAFAIEPVFRLAVTRYDVTPSQWPAGFQLRLVVLADIHAKNPWMDPARIAAIARAANALQPDMVLLAGDYETSMRNFGIGSDVPMETVAETLSILRAPLGVYGVLGNHDMGVHEGANVRRWFPGAGLTILENKAVRLEHAGRPFWLLGLADQWGWAWRRKGSARDDLPGTLAQIGDDAPAILLAHEPDIFPSVPHRIALTISGHTHGGQVRVPGFGPLVIPSRYDSRYAYGHIVEDDRHLVVSAGLGTSGIPVRFLVPPEIVVINLGGRPDLPV